MHGCYTTCLLMGGLLLWGCEDAKDAAMSQQTSWQVGCVPDDTTCGTSRDAHRQTETAKLKVTCSRDEVGLNVTLIDPGQDPTGVTVKARSASKLAITRLDPAKNRCFVEIEEEERATGGTLRVSGECGDSNKPCKVTGSFDKNGWDFDGEVVCEGLSVNGQGIDPDFRLQAPGTDGEPMVLQVANCK